MTRIVEMQIDDIEKVNAAIDHVVREITAVVGPVPREIVACAYKEGYLDAMKKVLPVLREAIGALEKK